MSNFHRSFCVSFSRKDAGLCIIIIIIIIRVFHISVSGWSFTGVSDSKSSQVSRTLLSILAVLNNVVVWMLSTRPTTSKSSSPFNNSFVTVPNALITIGIIVTFMFHSFFQFPCKVQALILLFKFFQFYFGVSRDYYYYHHYYYCCYYYYFSLYKLIQLILVVFPKVQLTSSLLNFPWLFSVLLLISAVLWSQLSIGYPVFRVFFQCFSGMLRGI